MPPAAAGQAARSAARSAERTEVSASGGVTLITRYGQTPHGADYGFGLTTFVAGLVLVPFSVLGFVVGKLTPRVQARTDAPALGYSLGSAIGGLVLAAGTGHLFPNYDAYTTAALVGIAAMAITAMTSLAPSPPTPARDGPNTAARADIHTTAR